MTRPAKPQKAVKERVFSALTVGIDPDNDPCGNYDDIRDNNSYVIDVTMYETAQAIFDEFDKGVKALDFGAFARLKKKWLVPVPDPEPHEICKCGVSNVVKNLPNISLPDFVEESPIGKRATREANRIIRSIRARQKQKRTQEMSLDHLTLPMAAEISLGYQWKCKTCGEELRSERSADTNGQTWYFTHDGKRHFKSWCNIEI